MIDSAKSQDELNLKEQYWIRYYDSILNGYNETDAIYKCGGNTYKSKSTDEMKIISKKISDTKIGCKNPNSKAVKCYNVISNKEITFNTVDDCRKFFGESTHRFITTRVSGKTKSLYKKEWKIAYLNNEYNEYYEYHKSGINVEVTDLNTGLKRMFISLAAAARELNLSKNLLKKKHNENTKFIINNYEFTTLS